MDARGLLHLATHPIHLLRRIQYRMYEARHPDEPWIAQGAVRFCDRNLRRDMLAVETGSGRSTSWFAQRVGRLVSIEHDAAWYEIVRAKLVARGLTGVDYRLVPLDHPAEQRTRPWYDPVPRYVAVFSELADASVDFVVIDGHYRQACVLAALPKIKPGGRLLIDNSNWLSTLDWGVPSSWPLVHRSSNVMTETSIWERPPA